jgi:hypothetical protein
MSDQPRWSQGDRIISVSGYLLVGAAIIGFLAAGAVEVWQAVKFGNHRATSTLDFVQEHSATLTLLVMAFVAATLGKQLLTTIRLAEARTIPHEDLPLVAQAVIDGKPEPIDQYVRLRSLSGVSGNFTKLGVTGLPLTTVALTLIFSVISLLPLQQAPEFLDLAKLTLGAFIGSFVQRQVEQRKQEAVQSSGTPARHPELMA